MQSCKYKLPCGWCDRKNEMCIYELQTQDINELPICEHAWYCSGSDTMGWMYTCSKCGKTKRRSYSYISEPNVTTIGDFNYTKTEQSSKDLEIDHIIRTVKNGKLPKLNGKN